MKYVFRNHKGIEKTIDSKDIREAIDKLDKLEDISIPSKITEDDFYLVRTEQ